MGAFACVSVQVCFNINWALVTPSIVSYLRGSATLAQQKPVTGVFSVRQFLGYICSV